MVMFMYIPFVHIMKRKLTPCAFQLGSSCCRHFNHKETVTVSYYPDNANLTLNNKLYSIRFQNVIAD